jgi:hypothetical protein
MKTIIEYKGYHWGIGLEFKIQDFWLGFYCKNRNNEFDIWFCLIPCFPIHYWSGRCDK